MTNRLTLLAILSAAVAFGQGAGMKQLKSVTGAEYVCTTNAVAVTQTAVTNEAALRRIGDLAGSNYVDAVAAGIEAGSVSHADVAGAATNAVYAGLAGVASNALTAGNANYASYANYASNVVNAGVANYAQVAGLATNANYASVANTASNAILVTGAQSNLIASAWQNRTDVQAGNWTYTSDGISITVTGYTGSETSVTLPKFIDGLPVSAIAANAFEGALFGTFNIPFAVSIGAEAFKNCLSLSTIDVNNVTSLGESAFAGCASLESFVALDLRVVPNYAFVGCSSLNAILLPSVVTIGESAFSGCALTSVDIPKVTNIGPYAFQSCFFGGLNLPKIAAIGAGAFTDCVNLRDIFYSSNVPADGGSIFSGIPPDQFTNFVLNTTATGWGTTFGDRPVSRMTAKSDYADVRYSIEMFGYTWTWNTEFHTFDVELDGGVTGQLFQEQHVYAKNMTGAPLLEGRAVCVRGAVGDNVLVGYADASDHTCQWTTIGLVTQTGGIANDGFGYVCTFGNVNDINTSAFQVSNTLWLASNGTVTNVEPVITATGSKIKLGTVLRAHATQGRVFVNVAVVPNWTDVGAVNTNTVGFVNTTLHDGSLNSTNGVYFKRNGTNYWILLY